VYEQGFWIAIGKKQYAYTYKEVSGIQRSLSRSNPTSESDVHLLLRLTNGEQVTFDVSENELFLNFSKMLMEEHCEYRQESMLERYRKGELLDFGDFQVNKRGIEIGKELIARTEISEVVSVSKNGASRQLQMKGQDGKTLASLWKDSMVNEYLFYSILDEEGIER
jgi:hypothetical protein